MGGRCAVAGAVAAWTGALLGQHLGTWGVLSALAAAFGLGLAGLRGPARAASVALVAALALGGAARASAHRIALEQARPELGAGDGIFRIQGTVSEPPEAEGGETVVVVSLRAAQPALRAGTRVRLRLPAGVEAEWSDHVAALVRLDLPQRLRNPGGHDARVGAMASALGAGGNAFWAVTWPDRGLAGWPRATVARWRRAIGRSLDHHLSPAARELVVPLVLGDRSGLSTDLGAELRASGLIHLLALSGLHVAWMAAIARGMLAALGRGVLGRAIAGAACAILYLGIAGPLPSLARAAASELLKSAGLARGRPIDPLQAMAVSVLAMVALAPGWALDLGFQLSCAATLGLVTVGAALDQVLRSRPWSAPLRPFGPTASAQLMAMPLLVSRFHALSWVAPLSNLAAVPVSGLLLTAAWLGAACDALAPGTQGAWYGACEPLAWCLRAVTERAAGLPGAMTPARGDGIAWVAAAGAALLAAATSGPRDLDSRSTSLGAPRVAALGLGALASGLALVLAATTRPLAPPPGRSWIVVLDVGQGDAIALGFEDGWWLVDAGARSPRYDAGESAVVPFFRWAGVRSLRFLVLTHDDGDHTGGAQAVRRALAVRTLLTSPSFPRVPGPGPRFGGEPVARGARLREGPPVRVLWPPAARFQAPGRGEALVEGARVDSGRIEIETDNDASLVLEVGEGASRALLLADVDSTVERMLPVAPGVALLKVAHHGSASSSGASWLARARPLVGAISCGRHNPFGHPDPRALGRLREAGCEILRTDEEGALWFESTPAGIRRLDWRKEAPSWPAARVPGAPCAKPRP